MRFEHEVKNDLWFMGIGCAVCSVLTAVGAVLIGEASIPVFLGCIVGWLLSFGNFFFMTVGIMMALETGDERLAKRKMNSSRAARTVIMLAVIALAILFPHYVHWLPVILATFYPKILIGARGYWNFFRHRNDPVPESTSNTSDAWDDEEEDEDGFEKFVGHFAKGNIPGGENKNDTGN